MHIATELQISELKFQSCVDLSKYLYCFECQWSLVAGGVILRLIGRPVTPYCTGLYEHNCDSHVWTNFNVEEYYYKYGLSKCKQMFFWNLSTFQSEISVALAVLQWR